MATQVTLTPDEFIRAVAKSGVVTDEKLRESISKIKKQGKASDASTVAASLVEDEALTRWQADNILAGKYKNFFLGKYRLLSLIGKGGMGAVYLAEHTMLNRRCAIKVLPGVFAKNKEYIERFMREAQAVAALDHPNIVRAYDVDKDVNDKREMYYLTMEYVEGKDVDVVVKERGLPDFVQAADIIRQTAEGLEYAHQRSIVHRDIKPANMLLNKDGVVKILDLGLARNFDDNETASLTAAQNATYLGTPDYLAPEQAIDCSDVDGRADIYSLGCSLYFLLTGSPPFGEGTIAQRLIAHQTKAPRAIKELRPDAPEELIDIVEVMMEKDRDDRYQTAKEVANALSGWLMDNAGDEWIEKNPAAVSTADGGMVELEEIDDGADAFDDLTSLDAAAMQPAAGVSGIGQQLPAANPQARPMGSSVGPMTSPLSQMRPGQQAPAKKSAFPMWAIIASISAGALFLIGILVVTIVVFTSGSNDEAGNDDDPLAQVDTDSDDVNDKKKDVKDNETGKKSNLKEDDRKGGKAGGKDEKKNGGKKGNNKKKEDKRNDNKQGTARIVNPPAAKTAIKAEIPFDRYDTGDLAHAAKWMVTFGAYSVHENKGINKRKGLVFANDGKFSDSELRREFDVPVGGTLELCADIRITNAKDGLPSDTFSPFALFIGTSGLEDQQRVQAGLSRVSNGTFDLNGLLPSWQRKNLNADLLGVGKGNNRSTDWLRIKFAMTRKKEQGSLQGSVTLYSLGKDGKQAPKEIAKQTSPPATIRKELWSASSWAVGFSRGNIDEAKVDEVVVDNFSVKVIAP